MDVKINKIVNLFNKKLFKEALAEIEIFFQGKSFLNEDSNKLAIIYNIKGLIYLSLDILNKSKESFIEAIRLNPDFYPAFYNLGITYFNLGQ
jgi:tetratricopeptide (TPR) repeat protein